MATIEHAFTTNLSALLSRLPDVREDDGEAIHDARVATRRLRGTARVLAGDHPSEQWQEIQRSIRTIGRALGKARDVDVSLDLLEKIERRSPPTAPAVAAVRARLLRVHQRRRRQLIKKLERQDIAALERFCSSVSAANGFRAAPWRTTRPGRALTAAIAAHAEDAQAAVAHASAVYFPRRAHAVRVALKKLRYLVELLDREEERRPALRALRRAQDTLGDLHDREVLAERLKRMLRRESIPAANMLADVLDGEARELFARYLDTRQRLTETCHALADWPKPHSGHALRRRMLTMGALALPSAAVVLFVTRASSASASDRPLTSG
jgi:CHAD domain-containing protein